MKVKTQETKFIFTISLSPLSFHIHVNSVVHTYGRNNKIFPYPFSNRNKSLIYLSVPLYNNSFFIFGVVDILSDPGNDKKCEMIFRGWIFFRGGCKYCICTREMEN